VFVIYQTGFKTFRFWLLARRVEESLRSVLKYVSKAPTTSNAASGQKMNVLKPVQLLG
jgi:hypothetical protein